MRITQFGARHAILLIPCLLLTCPGLAAEWFEEEGASCSGISSLGAGFSALLNADAVPLTSSGGGRFYASLSAETFKNFTSRKEDYLSASIELNQEQARNFSKIISEIADSGSVPVFFNMGVAVLTGMAMGPIAGTTAGLIFSHLTEKFNAVPLALNSTSAFMAEGGRVYRRSAITTRQRDRAIFYNSSIEYSVSIGRETRTIVYYACSYPARIVVSEFQTTVPPGSNGKIVRPSTGSAWRVWDIDDNKYDTDPLTYTRQDSQFYYFDRQGAEGSDVHRISLLGGPWQRRKFGAAPNDWQTFYQHTTLR